MEKIPWPVLANILTIVGSFPEVLRLLLVCKKWKTIIEGAYHYVTFQGTRIRNLAPWKINFDTSLRYFIEGWKLASLDLRKVSINVKSLAKIIAANSELLNLDLSNSNCDLIRLWEETSEEMEISNVKNHKLEELRLTNFKRGRSVSETVAMCFPNLLKLYIGNTSTSWEDIKLTLGNLKKLQILDISHCFSMNDLSLKELDEVLTRESLKTVFLEIYDIEKLNLFKNKHIEIINSNIESLLNNTNSLSDLELLESFLKNGGDANLLTTTQDCPQKEFIMKSSDEELLCKAFQLLIRYNLDLYQSNSDYVTLSIQKRMKKLLEIFLRYGTEIWQCSSSHDHPMVLAAKSYDSSMFQLFIDYNYHKQDNYFDTACNPICASVTGESWRMFKYLANNSVPYFRCPYDKNILFTSNEYFDTLLNSYCYLFNLEMLYEAAQHYIKHQKIERALKLIEIITAKEGHIKEQQILENLNKLKISNFPLIRIAAETRVLRILYKLTEKGFDVSMCGWDGMTALMSASIKGYIDVINFLCLCGAVVNQKDSSGQTALHYAAKKNQTDAIKELVKYGAVINSIDNDGYTPLDLAILDSFPLLKELGAVNGVPKQTQFNVESDNRDPYSFY